MSRFDSKEVDICISMFNSGKTTKEVQDFLMQKYNIKRSSTSGFVKMIRKKMGIYQKLEKVHF